MDSEPLSTAWAAAYLEDDGLDSALASSGIPSGESHKDMDPGVDGMPYPSPGKPTVISDTLEPDHAPAMPSLPPFRPVSRKRTLAGINHAPVRKTTDVHAPSRHQSEYAAPWTGIPDVPYSSQLGRFDRQAPPPPLPPPRDPNTAVQTGEPSHYIEQNHNGAAPGSIEHAANLKTPNHISSIRPSNHHLPELQFHPTHTPRYVAPEEDDGSYWSPSNGSSPRADQRMNVSREAERLTRNREAAAMFRQKSTKTSQQLQDYEYEASVLNRDLNAEHNSLRSEVHYLRAALRQHVGCDCVLIQRYVSATNEGGRSES